MQEEEQDNIALTISQKGNVQITGAPIATGVALDAARAITEWARSQIITPQFPPTPDKEAEAESPVEG